MLVDSHVNLHGERYADDLADVLQRAKDANIGAMLTISDRLDSLPEIRDIAGAHDNMWHSVGIHPHHAKDYADITSAELIRIAREDCQAEKVVGIGECGLDFYYGYSDENSQEHVFRQHVMAAKELDLPLIIHTRDADDMMMGILKEMGAQADESKGGKGFKILLHCYTSGMALAEYGMEIGGYIAFSGIITFKKADDVRAVAEAMPMDRIIIETDCPFLAPVPYRGKRNEPSFLPAVAAKLAEIKGISADDVAKITTENFFNCFDQAKMG